MSDELQERIEHFINSLLALQQQQDRAALAALRSGLGQEPGAAPRMHQYVIPFLSAYEASHEDGFRRIGRWFYVVGALFAYHPEYARGASLGESLRRIKDTSSMEMRFVALLNSHPDDLFGHLRQAVGLLRAKETPEHRVQPVDWFRLLSDLIGWADPQRKQKVQQHWARDYYREPGAHQ